MSTDDDQKRTLIKIGPPSANIGHIAVTAGDAKRTGKPCSGCGAELWEFTLYIWTDEGPKPIFGADVCGAEAEHAPPPMNDEPDGE